MLNYLTAIRNTNGTSPNTGKAVRGLIKMFVNTPLPNCLLQQATTRIAQAERPSPSAAWAQATSPLPGTLSEIPNPEK